MHRRHLALEKIGLTLGVAGETTPEDTDALKAQTTCDQNDLTCGKSGMASLVGFIVILLTMTPIGTTGSSDAGSV
ncbi:hypothetical protein QR685DRAFT_568959 [Neurospora intermedia]|uniref:Uncharacterized protein n=1 Tax=Neurospora intermedia TaxID=5142 RepID=A0ABR3DJC6_NEUIN